MGGLFSEQPVPQRAFFAAESVKGKIIEVKIIREKGRGGLEYADKTWASEGCSPLADSSELESGKVILDWRQESARL